MKQFKKNKKIDREGETGRQSKRYLKIYNNILAKIFIPYFPSIGTFILRKT